MGHSHGFLHDAIGHVLRSSRTYAINDEAARVPQGQVSQSEVDGLVEERAKLARMALEEDFERRVRQRTEQYEKRASTAEETLRMEQDRLAAASAQAATQQSALLLQVAELTSQVSDLKAKLCTQTEAAEAQGVIAKNLELELSHVQGNDLDSWSLH